MKKRIILSTILMMSFVCVGLSQHAFANPDAGVVNVGNKVCPVSGESIGSMGDAFKVQHDGKEYNLCCKMCVKDFEKNPEKYIKIVEAEASAKSAHEGHDMGHMSEKKESAEKSGDHGDHDHH